MTRDVITASMAEPNDGAPPRQRPLLRRAADHLRRRRRLVRLNEYFRKFAQYTAKGLGSPWTFILCAVIVLVWILTGPVFHFSDAWQLIINTFTNVVTFLAVFLIQNTQNRDAKALHLKLDELIRAVEGARTGLIDLENLTDEELDLLQRQFKRLRRKESIVPVAASDNPSA